MKQNKSFSLHCPKCNNILHITMEPGTAYDTCDKCKTEITYNYYDNKTNESYQPELEFEKDNIETFDYEQLKVRPDKLTDHKVTQNHKITPTNNQKNKFQQKSEHSTSKINKKHSQIPPKETIEPSKKVDKVELQRIDLLLNKNKPINNKVPNPKLPQPKDQKNLKHPSPSLSNHHDHQERTKNFQTIPKENKFFLYNVKTIFIILGIILSVSIVFLYFKINKTFKNTPVLTKKKETNLHSKNDSNKKNTKKSITAEKALNLNYQIDSIDHYDNLPTLKNNPQTKKDKYVKLTKNNNSLEKKMSKKESFIPNHNQNNNVKIDDQNNEGFKQLVKTDKVYNEKTFPSAIDEEILTHINTSKTELSQQTKMQNIGPQENASDDQIKTQEKNNLPINEIQKSSQISDIKNINPLDENNTKNATDKNNIKNIELAMINHDKTSFQIPNKIPTTYYQPQQKINILNFKNIAKSYETDSKKNYIQEKQEINKIDSLSTNDTKISNKTNILKSNTESSSAATNDSQEIKSKKTPPSSEPDVQNSIENKKFQKSTIQIDKDTLFSEQLNTINKYLTADTWQQRLPYIRERSKIENELEQYYSTNKYSPSYPTNAVYHSYHTRSSNGNKVYAFFVKTQQTPRGFILFMEKDGENNYIDWMAEKNISNNTLEKFTKGKLGKTIQIRTFFSKVTSYSNKDFSDLDDYHIINLNIPKIGSPRNIYAFIDKKSKVGTIFKDKIITNKYYSGIIKLKRIQYDPKNDSKYILKVLELLSYGDRFHAYVENFQDSFK